MNSERFILGDPKFLSGSKASFTQTDYSSEPAVIRPGDGLVTSKEVAGYMSRHPGSPMSQAVKSCGSQVRPGDLNGYHHRPSLNVFLVEKQEPSVGVEIETVMRNGVRREQIRDHLCSNWFHFERDGSLPDGGYELITEPLPPYIYRDPHTWTGLQNAVVPYLSSYGCSATGLHVHVGLRQFADIDTLPFRNDADRMNVGKHMAILLYFCVLDRAFVDRVMLRKNGSYCSGTTDPRLQEFQNAVRSGVTANEVVDYAVKLWGGSDAATRRASRLRQMDTDGSAASRHYNVVRDGQSQYHTGSVCGICCGHSGNGSEMNATHLYTVEFRRGKGTLQAVSIHRMVELATLVVRYAGSLARKPVREYPDGTRKDVTVTPQAMYEFIAANTENGSLRQMALAAAQKGN